MLQEAPWRDVAKALQEQRAEVESDKRTLERHMKVQRRLLNDMQQWVAAQLSLQTAPNAAVPTWRDVSLLASPVSRWLGKEWILKQLYDQTDHVFQKYGFPSPHLEETIQGHLSWEFNDEGYVSMYREQNASSRTDFDGTHTLLSMQALVLFDIWRLPDGRTFVRDLKLFSSAFVLHGPSLPRIVDAADYCIDISDVPPDRQGQAFATRLQDLLNGKVTDMRSKIIAKRGKV
ncbi:Aste57867_8633 [Aphanomyces stellatus]|uniref:Aste57867_8633 protein n=1 Tax=Aphanomyces stellatus TaxID=120398 RepID=A0A485KKX5_9STRA|nr:hypothetical protein As57867_008599 [Aphanomyces stellatus]VFT85519.1 Aste57867_8633 [Aphanomyces stellatus]